MNPEKMCKRVDAGVSLLVWFVIYTACFTVLLCDVFIWRP